MPDDISKKLEELRRQAILKLSEAQAIVGQMNIVETLFDLPLTVLGEMEPVAGAPVPPLTFVGTQGSQESGRMATGKRKSSGAIRPDEFFGDEPMEAAKKYIRSVGYAVSFDEITDAVQRGGAATKGADWRDKLEISLKRSPYQVITVADKTYGLSEFYTEEQLKRFRNNRRGDADRSKKKPKPKGRPKSKAASTPKKAPATAKGAATASDPEKRTT